MSCAEIDDEGCLVIAVVPGGPLMVTLTPTPWMTEAERQSRFELARKGVYYNGMFIESEKRVRNPLSDKKGEKTTLEMTIRPCRTKDEAGFVAARIMEAV